MRKTLLFSILIFLVGGCNKDKFTTAPQLKYESVNTKQLHNGESIEFTLSFTDAEGDIGDKIYIQKIVPPCPSNLHPGFIDSTEIIPEIPSAHNLSGQVIITYPYNDLNPECAPRNDTAIFKFVLRDKAQHLSDTAVSDAIIIYN